MPAFSRPTHLAIVAAILMLTVGISSTLFGRAPQVYRQAPGYYRTRVGDFEITVLLDGTHPFPAAEVLTQPPIHKDDKRLNFFSADPAKAKALLAAADLTAPTEGSINAFLVNTGSKLILIDSGAGSLYGPCCGHLLENLRAAGYSPEQVDDVFLTHLHADHVGGIARGGQRAFPRAVIHASKLDADYWLNDKNEAAAPGFLRPMFEGAKASLKPYIEAGQFVTFEGPTEFAPGVNAIPAPGHTPGHTFYELSSKGQTLLLWGDVVHVASVQFPNPAITVEYDSDENLAEVTRRRTFARAVSQTIWVGAAHISFPGLGHVGAKDNSFIWIPSEYTTRVGKDP